MKSEQLKAYRNYHWIVVDPDMLGGRPAIRAPVCRYHSFYLAWQKE